MTLLCMGARFKYLYYFKIPWFYLNLCLHFYLYGCLCWKVNIIVDRCLKCIFEHLDFTYDGVNINYLFLLCIIMIWAYLLYVALLFFLLNLVIIHSLSDVLTIFYFYVHDFVFLDFYCYSKIIKNNHQKLWLGREKREERRDIGVALGEVFTLKWEYHFVINCVVYKYTY